MTFKRGNILLALFVSACGGAEQSEAPSMALPTWDGRHIVCNEEVSFAADAAIDLPVFAADDRLGFCARSMKYIELHRQHGAETSYFGVAAATTASLAATYAPLVRRAYSESTWEIMAELSREVEGAVDAVAAHAGQGAGSRFFGGLIRGSAQFNTQELVRADQEIVQARLDVLAAERPEDYAQLIQDVNGTFNPTNRLLIAAISRNPFFKAYEAGLVQVRARHGGMIDFAKMEQRVEIGQVLVALIEGISVSE